MLLCKITCQMLLGEQGGVRVKKTWTQSDIRFCENEGSKRFKINEKGSQMDRKSMRKLIQNHENAKC